LKTAKPENRLTLALVIAGFILGFALVIGLFTLSSGIPAFAANPQTASSFTYTESIAVGETKVLTPANMATDSDMDTLTIIGVATPSDPSVISAVVNADGTVSITGLAAGTSTLTLRVWDGTSPTSYVDVVLTITVTAASSPYIPSTGGGSSTTTTPSTDEPVDKPITMPFTDVSESNWFYEDVKYVYVKGLFNGTSDTQFSPNTSMTRAMMVTVLWRLQGSPEGAESAGFADVSAGTYYYEAVNWAAANGIVLGYNASKFGPNDSITREQITTILYRFANFLGKGPVGSWTANPDFVDMDKVSAYANEGVVWAWINNIVNGRPGGIFDPRGKATRAEVAAMLHRFMVAFVD